MNDFIALFEITVCLHGSKVCKPNSISFVPSWSVPNFNFQAPTATPSTVNSYALLVQMLSLFLPGS